MSFGSSIRTMNFQATNFSLNPLVFIPNVLRLPGANPQGTTRPACPTRHLHGHLALAPCPPAFRLPTVAVHSRQATSNYQSMPSIVNVSHAAKLQTVPLVGAPSSQSDPSANGPDASGPLIRVPQRRGHRHTKESRKKIGIANRGNVPWNKGRKHSEETKRKIAENTRRAMLRPEMRQILQQRAKGRKHSEATKLKIRETARLTRGTVKSAERRQRKSPVPFSFRPDVVRSLNDCIATQIEQTFDKDEHHVNPMYVVRERRIVSKATREKLSQRIKEMWNDPSYRSRVASGVQERYKRLSQQQKPDSLDEVSDDRKTAITPSSTKRRPRMRTRKDIDENRSTKHTLQSSTGQRNMGGVDIVLDPDSLKGWTKEDLGIIGTHDAGRIDEDIMGKMGQDEWPFPLDHEDYDALVSPGPHRLLQDEEASDGIYAPYEDHGSLTPELDNSELSTPVAPPTNELNFSRLDITTESAPGKSPGNQTDLFKRSLNSFSHEGGGEIDVEQVRNGDVFPSRSMIERFDNDVLDHVGNAESVMPQSFSLNHVSDDTNLFDRF